jgi:ketosteroid isomerase-like protein
MEDEQGPSAADRRFFAALLEASLPKLEELLAEDFLLIDVMSGSEVPRAAMLEALGSGQLQFQSIEPAERRVRRYGSTAVVTGRTEMAMRFGDSAVTACSRYTHVFVEQDGRWRMVAAQGTPIAPMPALPAMPE